MYITYQLIELFHVDLGSYLPHCKVAVISLYTKHNSAVESQKLTYPYSAGIDFSLQNLTSVDVRI